MIYTEKMYREARMVGVKAHSNQSYDEIFPYEKHLDDVVDVLKRFGFSGKFIVAGYLHDGMEDDGLSYKDIFKHFGKDVAEMVYCVSDESGRNRKEKKAKTLPKTASNSDAIILKLADRIANVEHGGKVAMYTQEYEDFRSFLFPVSTKEATPMWDCLDKLMGKVLVA